MAELKPCPFCGVKPLKPKTCDYSVFPFEGRWAVSHYCNNVMVKAYGNSEEAAIETWNSRNGKDAATMKIREHAKKAGVEVVGKLSLMGKWDLSNRWYMDEAGTAFVLDNVIGGIRIIPKKKKEET